MCGIFGYTGKRKNAIELAILGIKKLEYRGYDSSGLAAITNGEIFCEKKMGGVHLLEALLESKMKMKATTAISHTRWATHGRPSEINAHPHLDAKKSLALVHNGIIDNYRFIREFLQKKGVTFLTETDTEIVSELIAHYYEGDVAMAVQKATATLEGSYAFAVIHKDHPNEIVCAAKESPLCIGIGKGEMFVSSDPAAFQAYTRRAIYLRASEVAIVTPDSLQVFDASGSGISKKDELLPKGYKEATKEGYAHYMLKEIFEQNQTIPFALHGRFSREMGTAILDELKQQEEELLKIERIVIVACGSSYHAGLIAAQMIEERARIPVQVEISSEFRYRNPIVLEKTLAIAISQSGETADTLAATRELKAKGAKIIGICNVPGSTLTREVDATLLLRAGPEVGVATTKAYSNQIVVLALLALFLARKRTMSQKEGKEFVDALFELPLVVQKALELAPSIEKLAKKYASHDFFFFMGRRCMHPTALEGALKLKEIAYVPAQGYPAGEIKHGPIALVNDKTVTMAFTADSLTFPKIVSNLKEMKSRGSQIIAFAEEGREELFECADDLIFLPITIDELATIPHAIASQLFAYYYAKERGCEIDKPRNLAKSVTVE